MQRIPSPRHPTMVNPVSLGDDDPKQQLPYNTSKPSPSVHTKTKDIFKVWYRDTSIAGLSHASSSEVTWIRNLWILLFLGAMCVTLYQVGRQFDILGPLSANFFSLG